MIGRHEYSEVVAQFTESAVEGKGLAKWMLTVACARGMCLLNHRVGMTPKAFGLWMSIKTVSRTVLDTKTNSLVDVRGIPMEKLYSEYAEGERFLLVLST